MGNKCVGKAGAFYLPRLHALLLNAAEENVTITDPTGGELDFGITDSFTIEIWAKIDDSGDGNVLSKWTVGANGPGYKVEVEAVAHKLEFTIGDSATNTSIQTTAAANDDKWHCWHFVRDHSSDELYIYKDGVLAATAVTDTTTATLATDAHLIWGGAINTRTIGAVTIFNTALTLAQCLKRHNGEAVAALQEYIVGEWLSLSGTGAKLYDDSGNANNGTITGATWTTHYDSATESPPDGSGKNYTTADANIRKLVVKLDTVALARNKYSYTVKGTITLVDDPGAAAVSVEYDYYHVFELGGFFSWSLDWVGETVDSTDFVDAGGGYRTFLAGLVNWTGTAEQHWSNKSISADIGGEQMIVKFYYAADKRYEGWAIITGLSTTTPCDALVDASLSFQGDEILSVETAA